MRQITLAISLLFVAAAAFAQTAIFVSPARGTVSGGDEIVIEISGPGAPACRDFRHNFNLRLGGVFTPATTLTADCRRFRAITPPHAAGTVDVTFQIDETPFTLPAGFTYTGLGTAPERANYEQILVPLPLPPADSVTPGANGAEWVTEAFVHNGSTSGLELFHNLSICSIVVCFGMDPYPGFAPGTHRLPPVDHPALWYVQKTRAKDVTFSMQVYDRSRGHENSGTEIPVVREAEFRRKEIYLPRVPITAAGRTSLRVYVPDSGSELLDIRIYRNDDPSLRPVALTVQRTTTISEVRGFPEVPGTVFIADLRREFPQLRDGMHRIYIVADTSSRLWAMASVANDTTNLVTIYSPQ